MRFKRLPLSLIYDHGTCPRCQTAMKLLVDMDYEKVAAIGILRHMCPSRECRRQGGAPYMNWYMAKEFLADGLIRWPK